jgi:hypothetical protein
VSKRSNIPFINPRWTPQLTDECSYSQMQGSGFMEQQPEYLNEASDDLRNKQNAAGILASVRKARPSLLDFNSVGPTVVQGGRSVVTRVFRTEGGNRVMKTARFVACATPQSQEPLECVSLSGGYEFPRDDAEESNVSEAMTALAALTPDVVPTPQVHLSTQASPSQAVQVGVPNYGKDMEAIIEDAATDLHALSPKKGTSQ